MESSPARSPRRRRRCPSPTTRQLVPQARGADGRQLFAVEPSFDSGPDGPDRRRVLHLQGLQRRRLPPPNHLGLDRRGIHHHFPDRQRGNRDDGDAATSATTRVLSLDWSYKQTSPSGPACRTETATLSDLIRDKTSDALTGLTASTGYIFTAYRGAGCAAASEIADVAFTTSAATLTVGRHHQDEGDADAFRPCEHRLVVQGKSERGAMHRGRGEHRDRELWTAWRWARSTPTRLTTPRAAAPRPRSPAAPSAPLAGAPSAPSGLSISKTYRAASAPGSNPSYPAAVQRDILLDLGRGQRRGGHGLRSAVPPNQPRGKLVNTSTGGAVNQVTINFAKGTANYGKDLEFQVQEDNSAGDGAWSASFAFTTAVAPAKPAAPTVTRRLQTAGSVLDRARRPRREHRRLRSGVPPGRFRGLDLPAAHGGRNGGDHPRPEPYRRKYQARSPGQVNSEGLGPMVRSRRKRPPCRAGCPACGRPPATPRST